MKLKKIIDELNPSISKSTLTKKNVKEFTKVYSSKNTEDVDWVELCNDVEQYGCYKYGFLLFINLLIKGLYTGSYADNLYSNLSTYKQMMHQRNTSLRDAMCGERIKYQIIYKSEHTGHQQWFSFSYINTKNTFILSIIKSHLDNMAAHGRNCPREIAFVFGKSLGKYENDIHAPTDFTEQTLYEQLDYYKNNYKDDENLRRTGIRFIINFYRWLVRNNPEHDYFQNAFHMSEKLLFNNRLSDLVEESFYFTTLNPNNIPYDKDKICFIMKGFENESTRLTNDDYVTINFSKLTNTFYRNLLIEYIVTSNSISAIKWVGIPAYIIEAMEPVYKAKQTPNYPNKKLNYLTNQEAIFIRKLFDSQDISLRTKNNKIGAVRRFISHCVESQTISVDDLFFEYLSQYEEPSKNTSMTISDNDLVKLAKYLSKKRKESIFYDEMFVIFHLAIQTEFRISQICHLQIDCIRPTIKPNQFEIISNAKDTHGRKNRYIITTATYNLLMDIINETEEIREQCPVDSMKQYIFVYIVKNYNDRPALFHDYTFSTYFGKICDELGINHYTASNLRDTHMTKSLEHIMRNGKSDLEMSVLSKHKYMDTTKNHYIELELEKMLESTYGITIGTELIQTDSKIVDTIPEELQGDENDVENGCGKCKISECVMTGPLPCLACEHFITTPKHEIFFKKSIEALDRLIKKTTNPHDKEDLVIIKELHVLYLKAIIKHKEGLSND